MLFVLSSVMLATVAFTYIQDPEYRATASVLIRTRETANLFPLDGAVDVTRSIAGEHVFLNSEEFRERATKLSPQPSTVKTRSNEDADNAADRSVVVFEALASEPSYAADAANTWSNQYIEQRHEFELAELASSIDTVLLSLDDLESRRADLIAPILELDDAIETSGDPVQTARLTEERLAVTERLSTEREAVEGQISRLNSNLTEMHLTQNLLRSPDWLARVNEPALVPRSPASPNVERNLAFGLVSAVILSLAAALLLESLDGKLRTVEDVVVHTKLDHLSSIPRIQKRGPTLGVTEAYQRVVSSLRLTRPTDGSDGCQVVLVTSAHPGEGKTTVATSIAELFTRGKSRTLVIDADLHRPTAGQVLEVANRTGLSDYLSGSLSIDDIIFESPSSVYLNVIPAGRIRSDSALDLLRTSRLEVLVEKLSAVYDQIIIDSPPLLAVVDPVEIAVHADCAILVVRSGRVGSSELSEAQRLLESARVPIVGTVLVAPLPEAANVYGYDAR